MAEKKSHSGLKRWMKRLGWAFLGIAVLVLVLRLSLKTEPVHNWVKNTITSTANDQLNGTLEIDKLSGDLWKEVTISGIKLDQQGTEFASVDSIYMAYNVWGLLDGKADVWAVHIYHPQANIRQENNEWNFQDLMVESSPSDTATGDIFPFEIGNLAFHSGKISIQSNNQALGSNLVIENLFLSSRLNFSSDAYSADLRDLTFDLIESNLENSLHVESSASAQENRLTLESLVLATGNSLVQSSGFFSPQDSSVQFDLSATPISWKDVADYAEEVPIRQDIEVSLGLEGNPQQFGLSLNMQARGLESLQVNSQFRWNEEMILDQLSVNIVSLDPANLFADTTLPSIRKANGEFNGQISLSDFENGRGDVRFSAEGIEYNPYKINEFSFSGRLDKSIATLDTEIRSQDQRFVANANVKQLWSELPSVQGEIRGINIDPGYWAADTSLAGNISFEAEVSGQGWYPENESWNYSLQVSDSELMDQTINALALDGQVNVSEISTRGYLEMQGGRLDLTADVQDMSEIPSYNYTLQSQDFDIGAFFGMPDFDTALNAKVSGNGSGTSIADLQLESSVVVDSSLVNGELVQNISANVLLRDTILTVDRAKLQSTIAEGSFTGRMNVLRIYDPDNKLSLNMQLKDLNALAPLADTEELRGEGEINGRLQPEGEEDLQFEGTFDISDVVYGSLYSADLMRGTLNTRMSEGLDYKADLDLQAPVFSGVKIQNLNLKSEGQHVNNRTTGSYSLQFSSPNEGRIEQSARFDIRDDSLSINTSDLNIISDYRILSLENPFDLVMYGDTLKMDTLRVSSGDGAFLEMAIPVANNQRQQAFIYGNSLNTSVIQSSLLGESYVQGMLSGRLEFAREDTSLEVDGDMLLSDVGYKETNFDTLQVETRIAEKRLEGMLSMHHEGKQIVDGAVNLPFRLGDPQTLPDEFFQEPINGTMRVNEISIERFKSLFEEAGVTNTTGLFSFRGSLEGEAGNPKFSADAKINNASLSGVSVDSVMAGLAYNHEERTLDLDASVMSLRQKAAEIVAEIPFYIDMKTFQVDLPQETDSIIVDVFTNDFNLAALNDFVDRQTMRSISGRLNGMVHIGGPLEDLETKGQLELRNGAFRLIPAGIQVNKMRSTLRFRPDEVQLNEFSAQSGNGKITASGIVGLTEMLPGDIDIKMQAQNFRIANTDQYNAVVDMNTRASGNISEPKITGNLNFVSGFLQLDNFGEESVESVELDDENQQVTNISMYDSLALDMDVSFNRRFFIRNQRYLEMELELDGSLDLLKEKDQDLELFGTMGAPAGYARPFGKQFDLQEGEVTFSGDPTNPQLMIRTQYEPPQTQEEIVIWYIIEGTVEDPKFRYESQPPMELENIVSYTLFGQPFYALDSWKQVVAGSGNTSATDVALDVLLDRVEALATQRLGIDVVRIDNTQSSGESGTQITTGWYLNPKVFFAIQNVITGSTPDTSFLLEYMLREDLKLMIRQGNDLRQGIDLKWNYDY